MAFRRAPQGPHFDPSNPTPPRRTPSLGPGQGIRNSMGTPLPTFRQMKGNLTVNGVNRTVSNLLRRFGNR